MSRPLRATRSGYLQTLDYDHLVEVARELDLVVELEIRPGDFMRRGDRAARLHCARMPDENPMDEIADAFVLGDQRTPGQDPEFVVDQLVELAVRALSPGTNDPYTAINCVDRLGAALDRVARRPPPPRRIRGPDGRIRLLRNPIDFPELLCAALDPIREYGREHPDVLDRILEVLDSLAAAVRRPEHVDELRWHAEKTMQSGRDGLSEQPSREALAERCEEVLGRLDGRAREVGTSEADTVGG